MCTVNALFNAQGVYLILVFLGDALKIKKMRLLERGVQTVALRFLNNAFHFLYIRTGMPTKIAVLLNNVNFDSSHNCCNSLQIE